jgi:hypothetical protein
VPQGNAPCAYPTGMWENPRCSNRQPHAAARGRPRPCAPPPRLAVSPRQRLARQERAPTVRPHRGPLDTPSRPHWRPDLVAVLLVRAARPDLDAGGLWHYIAKYFRERKDSRGADTGRTVLRTMASDIPGGEDA